MDHECLVNFAAFGLCGGSEHLIVKGAVQKARKMVVADEKRGWSTSATVVSVTGAAEIPPLGSCWVGLVASLYRWVMAREMVV